MDQTRGPVVCQLGGAGAVIDACYTLAGDKVATCSSSGAVQVWACSSSKSDWDLLHREEVPDAATALSWAHPEHGLVLAVGTKRGTVFVIQGSPFNTGGNEQQLQQQQQPQGEGWRVSGKLPCGRGSISALAFAPRQYGLLLAAACLDQGDPAAAAQLGPAGVGGTVALWEAAGRGGGSLQWTQLGSIKLPGPAGGVRCMCWREADTGLPPLLAVGHGQGGSIWAYQQANMAWQEVCSLSLPSSSRQPLVAVDWAPPLGRPFELLAASYGKTVVLFKVLPAAATADGQPRQLEVSVVCELQHPEAVWKLEFNMLANTLGCSLDVRPEIWFWVPPLTDGPWYVASRIAGAAQQPVEADGGMLLEID